MEQVPAQSSSEEPPLTQAQVVMRLRWKILDEEGFHLELKGFLQMSDETYQQLGDVKQGLLMAAINRMHENPGFTKEVEDFIRFIDRAEELKTRKNLHESTSARVAKALESKKKEPSIEDKREFLKGLLDTGYTQHATEYNRKAKIIREEQSKSGFFSRLMGSRKTPSARKTDSTEEISPQQMIQHLHKNAGSKKKTSVLSFPLLQSRAAKNGIPCGPFSSSPIRDTEERGYLVTDDGYYLLIDLNNAVIHYQSPNA